MSLVFLLKNRKSHCCPKFDVSQLMLKLHVAYKKETTYVSLELRQKSTDVNTLHCWFKNERRMVWTWLTSPKPNYVAALPCESKNTENVILHRHITKENCIICIIASSEWTRVAMCLKFTYLRCYTTMHIWNDSWHRRPAKRLMQTWFDFDQDIIDAAIDQWHDYLRSCVRAGGHFEHMLWHDCSLLSFTRTLKLSMLFDACIRAIL